MHTAQKYAMVANNTQNSLSERARRFSHQTRECRTDAVRHRPVSSVVIRDNICALLQNYERIKRLFEKLTVRLPPFQRRPSTLFWKCVGLTCYPLRIDWSVLSSFYYGVFWQRSCSRDLIRRRWHYLSYERQHSRSSLHRFIERWTNLRFVAG